MPRSVNHPDRERFLQLRQKIHAPEVLQEAQTILIRCGAISYAIAHLLRRHERSKEILDSAPMLFRDCLEELLDNAVKPVERLFSEARRRPSVEF